MLPGAGRGKRSGAQRRSAGACEVYHMQLNNRPNRSLSSRRGGIAVPRRVDALPPVAASDGQNLELLGNGEDQEVGAVGATTFLRLPQEFPGNGGLPRDVGGQSVS